MLSSNTPTYQHNGTPLEGFQMAARHFKYREPGAMKETITQRAASELETNSKVLALFPFERCRRTIFAPIQFKALQSHFELGDLARKYAMSNVEFIILLRLSYSA